MCLWLMSRLECEQHTYADTLTTCPQKFLVVKSTPMVIIICDNAKSPLNKKYMMDSSQLSIKTTGVLSATYQYQAQRCMLLISKVSNSLLNANVLQICLLSTVHSVSCFFCLLFSIPFLACLIQVKIEWLQICNTATFRLQIQSYNVHRHQCKVSWQHKLGNYMAVLEIFQL